MTPSSVQPQDLAACPFCSAPLEPYGPDQANHPRDDCWLSSVCVQRPEFANWNRRGSSTSTSQAPAPEFLRYDCVLTPDGKAEMYADENGAYVWFDHVAPYLRGGGDALDGARLDFIDSWVQKCKAAGHVAATFTLDTKSTGREQIDAEIAAIAASTAQEGK